MFRPFVLKGLYSLPGTPQLRSKPFKLRQEKIKMHLVCMGRDREEMDWKGREVKEREGKRREGRGKEGKISFKGRDEMESKGKRWEGKEKKEKEVKGVKWMK